jgi:opacity protein-like surface antigen
MPTLAPPSGSDRPPSRRAPSTAASFLAALPAVAALGLLAVAGSAAHAESEFGRPGGYVSGGVAGATEMFSGPYDLSGSGIDVGTALIVGGRLGYRANPYVAFEAAVDYSVEGFELTVPGSGTATAKALVATGNLKLYPGDWRIQPFVLGGVGVVRGTSECKTAAGVGVSCLAVGLSDSAVEFGGRVGGGLDFYLTRNLALSGEVTYVIPTGDLGDLDFLTFGGQLVFRF